MPKSDVLQVLLSLLLALLSDLTSGKGFQIGRTNTGKVALDVIRVCGAAELPVFISDPAASKAACLRYESTLSMCWVNVNAGGVPRAE